MSSQKKYEKPMAAVVRDAGGLKDFEKVFLHDLASHKGFEERGRRELAQKRMGLSDRKFRKATHSLPDKGLVTVVQEPGRPTKYRLNVRNMREWTPTAEEELQAKRNERHIKQEAKAQEAASKPVSTTNKPMRRARPIRQFNVDKSASDRSGHQKGNELKGNPKNQDTEEPG